MTYSLRVSARPGEDPKEVSGKSSAVQLRAYLPNGLDLATCHRHRHRHRHRRGGRNTRHPTQQPPSQTPRLPHHQRTHRCDTRQRPRSSRRFDHSPNVGVETARIPVEAALLPQPWWRLAGVSTKTLWRRECLSTEGVSPSTASPRTGIIEHVFDTSWIADLDAEQACAAITETQDVLREQEWQELRLAGHWAVLHGPASRSSGRCRPGRVGNEPFTPAGREPRRSPSSPAPSSGW